MLFLISFFSACTKTDSSMDEGTFIKMIEADGDYLARNSDKLSDGSILVFCTGLEDKLNSAEYGDSPSFIVKYSSDRKLLWKKEIPNTVFKLWNGFQLSNGNIFVCGYNEEIDSELAGFLILDENGDVIKENSFINQHDQGFFQSNNTQSMDALELDNGTIAVVMGNISGSNQPLTPRLVIFDDELNILVDNKYQSGSIILNSTSTYQIKLCQDNFGHLFFVARIGNNASASIKLNVVVYRLSIGDYTPDYRKVLFSDSLYNTTNLAFSSEGFPTWAHLGPNIADSLYEGFFNLGNQEMYYIGNTIIINQLDIENDSVRSVTVDGFPNYAYLRSIKRCSDGGYILVGSCNININLSVPSEFRILLVKLDANLKLEWLSTPVTLTSSVGWGVEETSTGFLLTGTHINFFRKKQPFLISLDKNGQLN